MFVICASTYPSFALVPSQLLLSLSLLFSLLPLDAFQPSIIFLLPLSSPRKIMWDGKTLGKFIHIEADYDSRFLSNLDAI